MGSETQAVVASVSEDFAEEFRSGETFVATDAEPHHIALTVTNRGIGYDLRAFRPKLPDGIENPE